MRPKINTARLLTLVTGVAIGVVITSNLDLLRPVEAQAGA